VNQPWQPNNQPGNLLMQQPPPGFSAPSGGSSTFQPFTAQQQAGAYGPASGVQGIPDILGIAEKAASAVQALTRQQQQQTPQQPLPISNAPQQS